MVCQIRLSKQFESEADGCGQPPVPGQHSRNRAFLAWKSTGKTQPHLSSLLTDMGGMLTMDRHTPIKEPFLFKNYVCMCVCKGVNAGQKRALESLDLEP